MELTFPTGAYAGTNCINCHNLHVEEQHTDCVTFHDDAGKNLHQLLEHENCVTCHITHSSKTMR